MRTEGPVQDDDNMIIDSLKIREFVYDASLKKKNTFWCSSTFCIPCTQSIKSERNIMDKPPELTQMPKNKYTEDEEESKHNTNSCKTSGNVPSNKIVSKKSRNRYNKTEGNDREYEEEYKLVRDKSRGNLVKKGNDKINVLMDDCEEEEDDERLRKLSKGKAFKKPCSWINKQNVSLSNRSNNSTILEHMVGFNSDNEDNICQSELSKSRHKLPAIEKLDISQTIDKLVKSRSAVIRSERSSNKNSKVLEVKLYDMGRIDEEGSSLASRIQSPK
jgi:hypothetical protein